MVFMGCGLTYTFTSEGQWRSQVTGIGRAPAIRLIIALTTLVLACTNNTSARVHLSGTNFGRARAWLSLAFATPLWKATGRSACSTVMS